MAHANAVLLDPLGDGHAQVGHGDAARRRPGTQNAARVAGQLSRRSGQLFGAGPRQMGVI
jgi:hypothetical protein